MLDPVQFLKELVSIPSPTGCTDDAVNWLMERALEAGMEAVVDEGALMIGPGASDLLLLGHIDTVPGNAEARIDGDGRLWGRGSVDAKGPLCSAFLALSRREDLHSRVKLVAVPDEEGSSETAYRIREQMEPCPTVILEPSSTRGITISYRGRILMETEVRSPPSHSGGEIPFATEILMDRIREIRDDTGGRVLKMEGDIERARGLIDIRYREEPRLPADDQMIKSKVLEKIPPAGSHRNNPLVRCFLRAIRANDGRPVFKRKTGTCDMNVIAEKWDVPLAAYGPGDGKLDHTDMEHISIEEYRDSIGIWSAFLEEYFRN